MSSKASKSDMGMGLALLFGLVSVGAAVVTATNSYNYAILHAQELETGNLLVTSGGAFGLAMLAAAVAIVAIHAYDA
ncbi:DUF7525 family protein [Haloarcula japonica]|jgi:hypothetical protein|nr:hypothetical protein [Haloarcula japonica]